MDYAPKSLITRDDIVRAGACASGVYSRCAGVLKTAVTLEEALGIAGECKDYVERAANLSGYGGYGYGGGYGGYDGGYGYGGYGDGYGGYGYGGYGDGGYGDGYDGYGYDGYGYGGFGDGYGMYASSVTFGEWR